MAETKIKTNQIFLITLALTLIPLVHGRYEPTWESIDSRPLPTWYDEAKFGIFIHWGVFSVPSFANEWFWKNWIGFQQQKYIDFMKKNYKPGFKYQDFAPQFQAEMFDPYEWAKLFEDAGAKYVVLTTKHHEGFCNWPTKYSWMWNAGDVGPNRDLVGDLAKAIRNSTDLRFGTYFSHFEWYNPLYNDDLLHLFFTKAYPSQVSLPQLRELVMNYEPDIVWTDGDSGPYWYWKSTEFLAWLYNDSPVKDKVVVNDRWGGTECHHGGYYTCQDHYVPGHLVKHKWENCMTIDKYSWGYRRDAQLEDFENSTSLIHQLVETVSCGGNLLLNIGPTHDGRIMPIFQDRLSDMGKWLKINGQAIYKSKPWRAQQDNMTKNTWYTSQVDEKSTTVYAILLDYPSQTAQNQLIVNLGEPITSPATNVTLVGYPKLLKWSPIGDSGISIIWPDLNFNQVPCKHAWVLRLDGVK
ncbi:unnamed protein product [Owenia fusiformis]|uniref:alpha-L-fucosidase n=1 Tax=Owenia fusiformis TaxID=6347 RepID=A0A8J1THT5_OWEFU|nr:unnamed protein product [Owenia fusiformis]